MKYLFLVFLLSSISQADTCSRSPLCDTLNDESFECEEKLEEPICNQFVETFKKTLEPQTCKSEKKTILGFCNLKSGNPYIDLHYDRLAKLPFKSALELFTSEKLRASMDGEVGETWRKRSLEDQKRLGKTLLPGKIISECREFEELKFKEVKVKELIYSEAKVGDFTVWSGDVPAKIINTKTSKSCVVKLLVSEETRKVKGEDLLYYKTYDGGRNLETIVDMKTCQKLWEAESYAAETHSGQTRSKVLLDKMKEGPWKKCGPCWNSDREACLRI
jgi:hypothetical protein